MAMNADLPAQRRRARGDRLDVDVAAGRRVGRRPYSPNTGMRYSAPRLPGRLYVQFVFGVKNAMPADERILDIYIETLQRLAPGALWCAAGIGASHLVVNEWAIARGGHTRTGLEDNVRLDRHTLAPSNAALVRRAVAICERHERPVATWRQARTMLGLREAA
jgi:3-keto-5-aminohexanoate cleavage enzyme